MQFCERCLSELYRKALVPSIVGCLYLAVAIFVEFLFSRRLFAQPCWAHWVLHGPCCGVFWTFGLCLFALDGDEHMQLLAACRNVL